MCTQNSYHKICEECGKEFIATMATTRYCSDRCSKLAYKHRKRDERLATTTFEVRERQRLALLDKNYLTITDAARLLQVSRTTLYKIISQYSIKLRRFTDRTVRIARIDLDKATENKTADITATTSVSDANATTLIIDQWMTREQVMKKYDVTYNSFYTIIKRHQIEARMIGSRAFYDTGTIERIFSNQSYINITEWYTFNELRQSTGMLTESICTFIKNHKIPKKKKGSITYVSKRHWDDARGINLISNDYYSIEQITEKYQISRNHLFCVLRDNAIPRIKRGKFIYLPKEEVEQTLAYRLDKINKI